MRADFLARAGGILDASLDYEETLRAVAQIAIPEVADWCAVSVLDDAGRAAGGRHRARRRAASASSAREISRRFPPDPTRTSGTYGVARSGETAYVREVTDEMLVAGIPDPEHLDLVRRLGLRSVIIAALKARGRAFGTLSLASAESGPPVRAGRRPAGRGARARAPAWRSTTPGCTPSAAASPTPCRSSCCPSACPRSRARYGRPLPRRRRAQRGRRRLLRRLPALADRMGARRRRRVGQGRRGRRRHRAGALHAARRGARGRPAQRRPAAPQHRDALRRHVAVRDRRHGLPLLRPRRGHRPAPRAGRPPGPRRACAATAAWRWSAATAPWPACAPTSPCTTSTCASSPARCCCSTPTA